MNHKIKRALISVTNKNHLLKILKVLRKFHVEILSSGGTFKTIKKLGYQSIEIAEYTDFKEMLDGRVKTLHPKIHAGILHNRKNKKHLREMRNKNYLPIDLVITNFYPFHETLMKTSDHKKIIEKIDIGGPSMVRSAAKNFQNVTVLTNTSDYDNFIKEIVKNNGSTSLKFRELMSSKAFGLTAYYDSVITNWFNKKLNIEFPDKITIVGNKIQSLRYGENPHQQSSLYSTELNTSDIIKQLNGKELSYNNYNDIFAALEILFSLKKNYATVIIKHANPCGVSVSKSSLTSCKRAFASDPVSAFGGIVACNYRLVIT